MRFKIIAAATVLAVCGTLLILGVNTPRPSAPPSVLVTFLGYTNNPTAGFIALFAVTNASPGPIIRHVGYSLQVPAATRRRWTNTSKGWFTNQGNLRAGAGEVLLVAAPTNLPTWRLSLTVLRDQPIRMTMRSLAREAHRIGVGREPTSGSSGYYRVASDAITP
jgi:hypothetical protein